MPSAIARALRGQPVDQVGHAGPAERAQRRPHRHAAGPPRQLGHLVQRVALVRRRARGSSPASPNARCAAATGSRDDRDAAVVRRVERLVRVGGPRVGPLDAVDAGAAATATPPPTARTRRRRAPTHRAGAPGRCTRRTGRTRRSAGCPPAARRSSARRRRPGRRRRASGRIRPWSSAGDRGRRAEAEVAQRQVDGGVPVLADAARGPGEPPVRPSPVEVPAGPGEHLLPAGGQAGEVGHRGAGDEPDVGVGRQAEQVEQPGRRRPPRRRSVPGCGVPHPGVLVPGADQPVGGQRGRQRAADHPAEEPAGRHRHQAGLDVPGQQVDHVGRVGRPVRAGPPRRGHDLVGGDPAAAPRGPGRRPASPGRAPPRGRGPCRTGQVARSRAPLCRRPSRERRDPGPRRQGSVKIAGAVALAGVCSRT